jgi:hypothetical protein
MVGIYQFEVGLVDSEGLAGIILPLDNFEFLEIEAIEDKLVLDKGNIFGEVRFFARAEVFSSRLYLLAVFEELGESAVDDDIGVIIEVVFLADGELDIKVGVSRGFVGIRCGEGLCDHIAIIDHDGVLFDFHR